MPLPSNTELATLDIAYLGQPFVQVEAKSLDTETLDIAYLGQPFVTVSPGIAVYVRASGVWKQANAMYVRASGVWKTVTTVSVRMAGVWNA